MSKITSYRSDLGIHYNIMPDAKKKKNAFCLVSLTKFRHIVRQLGFLYSINPKMCSIIYLHIYLPILRF